MAQAVKIEADAANRQSVQLKLSRVFHAKRETVFKAWSTADHVKRWFAPEPCTVPQAKVDMRVGGPFDLTMRLPKGEEHVIRGTFVEVVPHRRLVIDMHVSDGAGKELFRALTELDFADLSGGTRMDVVQTYTILDPAAAQMLTGAPQGWQSTLDNLEKEAFRMEGRADSGVRSVVHGTFSLARTYDASVARVWRALTHPQAKQKWFAGTPGKWEMLERHMDVRVGGSERLKGRWESGMVTTFDATYHDVVENERLVYSYVMHLGDQKISVSLATLQLQAEGSKTTLKVTEQGAFLDGYDDGSSREHGTGFLLDALGASLAVE